MEKLQSLKNRIHGDVIHNRSLNLKTYPIDEENIIVEGVLLDERFTPVYNMVGRQEEPGVVHHMVIRLLIGGPMPLAVHDAEAEMPRVPRERCHRTLGSIKGIIGLKIQSGFGEKVRHAMGGTKGCAHLTHLVVTMGQEAVHGYWANRRRNPQPIPSDLEQVEGLDHVVNSCRLWREDGPLVNELKNLLRKRGNPANSKSESV